MENPDSAIRAFTPTRRCALLAGALATMLMAASGCDRAPVGGAGGGQASAQAPANVVIFLIDTLRADRLGAYGYTTRATSPTIDAIAREGVVFDQCSAPAPWTLPSVASLQTSLLICEHGVVNDGQRIADAVTPMAERLKQFGYATCSYFGNPYAGPMSGLHRGFDLCKMVLQTGGAQVDEWLGSVPAGPFYVYIHNTEPHNPWEAKDSYLARFGPLGADVRRQFWAVSDGYRKLTRYDYDRRAPIGSTDNTEQQEAALRQLEALRSAVDPLYDARVLEADEQVRSVIDVLKRRNQWDRTIFIVTADHGEEMGEHGGWQHDQSVYDELIRVPLIIRFPVGQFAGKRVKTPVSLIDVMPTVFDYLKQAGLARGVSGRSLMPLIRDEASAPRGPRITAMRNNKKKYFRPWKERRGDVNVVVRDGSWKGILNAEVNGFELYDLSSDAGEKSELSGRQPQRAAALRELATRWLANCGPLDTSVGREALENLDQSYRKTLETLGYVGGDDNGAHAATQPGTAPGKPQP